MSSTETRRPLAQAREDAEAFRALFNASTVVEWHIAGSVRREKPDVGDIEHVVLPHHHSWLWSQLEEMTLVDGELAFGADEKPFTKAVYPDGTHRWGQKHRGVMYRGFRHEIFIADEANLGAILAIRTGPADYSQKLMTRLRQGGKLRMDDGYVRLGNSMEVVAAKDERAFFALCLTSWIEPRERGRSC